MKAEYCLLFISLIILKGGEKMKTIVMEKPDRISLPDEMHPSYLDVGEYGIITKSVYLDLVGTLVISVWREWSYDC